MPRRPVNYHPLRRQRIAWDEAPTIGSNWLSTGSAQLQQRLQERDRLQLLYDYTRHLASYTRDAFDRGRLYADSARLEKAIAEAEEQIKEAETMLHTTLPLGGQAPGGES